MIDLSKYNNKLIYKKNKLFLENVSLNKIANKFDTPIFCYSSTQISNNFNLFKSSFTKLNL